MYHFKPTKPKQAFLIGLKEGHRWATDGSMLVDLDCEHVKIPAVWELAFQSLQEGECVYMDVAGNHYTGFQSYATKTSERRVEMCPPIQPLIPSSDSLINMYDTGISFHGSENSKGKLSMAQTRVFTNVEADIQGCDTIIDIQALQSKCYVDQGLIECLFWFLKNPTAYAFSVYVKVRDGHQSPMCFYMTPDVFFGVVMPLRSVGPRTCFLRDSKVNEEPQND